MKNIGSENNLAIVYLYNIIGLIKIISYISKCNTQYLHLGWHRVVIEKKINLWNKNICLAHNFPFFIKSKLNSIQNSYKNYKKLQTTQPAQNSPNFKFCVINIPPGNALARVQRVHEPADLWDITFCTRWFWDPELSFIEQTAPADPNS